MDMLNNQMVNILNIYMYVDGISHLGDLLTRVTNHPTSATSGLFSDVRWSAGFCRCRVLAGKNHVKPI